MSESTQRDGWKKLLRYWGTKEVISTIAGRYFEEQERVLKCSKIDKNRCKNRYRKQHIIMLNAANYYGTIFTMKISR